MRKLWMIAREMEGWAEAGGVKDVVRDLAETFPTIDWEIHVVLPLYGFLKEKVFKRGERIWTGQAQHPVFQKTPFEMWRVREHNFWLYFLRSETFDIKKGIYTYTLEEEKANPNHPKGEGYSDGPRMNLEFQWGLAEFWFQSGIAPELVLGHDGHVGFLPAIAKTHFAYGTAFLSTRFHVLIHNAGPHYRQEMQVSAFHEKLLNLPRTALKDSLLDHHYDPLVAAARYGRLATVSENYAQELLTGKNDHYSGPFGRFLREHRVPLKGITNGISPLDKDPRFPERSKLPVPFDPLRGDLEGKKICRQVLREQILLKPSYVYGRIAHWEGPLYIMQGRLTTQKGVEALLELVARALREKQPVNFIVMALGERRYEEKAIRLARNNLSQGRLIFINKYDDALARLLFASGDFFLMPSEYEPCGLTDLKAQLMGTLPIVHRVGGLTKIHDGETGFTYSKNVDRGFWGAFLRSLHLYEHQGEVLEIMRKKAFLSVLEEFQWKRIVEEKYIPWMLD